MRMATAADAPVIAQHRVRMFRDMGAPPETEAAIEAATAAQVALLLTAGEYVGWLAEADGAVVAGVGVLMHPRLPRHENPAGRPEAYLLNVYTEPAYRREGLATRLIEQVFDWCRAHDIPRVALHASDEGRSVYEQLGFKPTNEMRREVQ